MKRIWSTNLQRKIKERLFVTTVHIAVRERNLDYQQSNGKEVRRMLHENAAHGIKCIMERQVDKRETLWKPSTSIIKSEEQENEASRTLC